MAFGHYEQAAANLDLARRMGQAGQEERQWTVTLAFYAVIHCIRHAASNTPLRPSPVLNRDSHAWDEWWMREHAPDLSAQYRALRRSSESCRYRLANPETPVVEGAITSAPRFVTLTLTGSLALDKRR
jgi:hypothetical protein